MTNIDTNRQRNHSASSQHGAGASRSSWGLRDHTGVSDNPEIPNHAIVAPHNLRAAGHNNGGPRQLPDNTTLAAKIEHPSGLAGPHPGVEARAGRAEHGAGRAASAAGAEASGLAAEPSRLAEHLGDALLGHGAQHSLGVDAGAAGAEGAALGAVSAGPPAQGAVGTRGPVGRQHPALIGDVVATADHGCNRAHATQQLARKNGRLFFFTRQVVC